MQTSTALVFLAIVAGCLAKESPEGIAEKCMEEVGVADRATLDKDEGKRKCFYKCMLVSVELMDADGTPNCDNAAKGIAEETSDENERQIFMEYFKQCADKTNESQATDPCEKGSILFQCMEEKIKEREKMVKNSKEN